VYVIAFDTQTKEEKETGELCQKLIKLKMQANQLHSTTEKRRKIEKQISILTAELVRRDVLDERSCYNEFPAHSVKEISRQDVLAERGNNGIPKQESPNHGITSNFGGSKRRRVR